MDESLRLGRIRGIPVGINWSLLLVFALIAAAVAGGRLPEAHPGHEPGVYVGAGVVAAVLLFASILVHELGHALLAQRRGIEVEGIVLWLFGGVSKFASEPMSPRDA